MEANVQRDIKKFLLARQLKKKKEEAEKKANKQKKSKENK